MTQYFFLFYGVPYTLIKLYFLWIRNALLSIWSPFLPAFFVLGIRAKPDNEGYHITYFPSRSLTGDMLIDSFTVLNSKYRMCNTMHTGREFWIKDRWRNPSFLMIHVTASCNVQNLNFSSSSRTFYYVFAKIVLEEKHVAYFYFLMGAIKEINSYHLNNM